MGNKRGLLSWKRHSGDARPVGGDEAGAGVPANGTASNGQDAVVASLQPVSSFPSDSSTLSYRPSDGGLVFQQDKASVISQAETILEEAGWDDASIGRVRLHLLRQSAEDIGILLSGSKPRVVAALKAFSSDNGQGTASREYQSIGDFIAHQPETKRSVRLSEVRALAWTQLQHNCRLDIRVVWKLQPPHYKEVDAFSWGQNPVSEQLDACSVYLRKVIDTPKQASWIDASQHPTLLTADPTGALPFSTKTTADLAICQRSTARPHAYRERLLVVFEVCKVVSTSEYYQAYAHLLLANVHSPRHKPVAVVTDLMDDWSIHWLDRRRICTFASPDRATALAILDLIADPQLSEHDRFLAQDLPILKRRRLELGQAGAISEDLPDDDVNALLPPNELLVMKEHKILQELNNIPWVASLQLP